MSTALAQHDETGRMLEWPMEKPLPHGYSWIVGFEECVQALDAKPEPAPTSGGVRCAAPGSERHWLVVVTMDGEEILQISKDHVSGIENVDDYAHEVMTCSEHLAAFIGGRSGASPNDEALRQAGQGGSIAD